MASLSTVIVKNSGQWGCGGDVDKADGRDWKEASFSSVKRPVIISHALFNMNED